MLCVCLGCLPVNCSALRSLFTVHHQLAEQAEQATLNAGPVFNNSARQQAFPRGKATQHRPGPGRAPPHPGARVTLLLTTTSASHE